MPSPVKTGSWSQSITDVSTYDLKPEMSAARSPTRSSDVIEFGPVRPDRRQFRQRRHGRPHRQALPAAIKAVEVVDECVGAFSMPSTPERRWLIVTADHGNCEQMWDPETDGPHTAHTTYDVPLIIVDDTFASARFARRP